ncbi:TPA: hypothetical protein NKX25_000442 [Vibrio parahaemolyticus]|uniref:hypothetical protein n=1 Tax=Vibrio parahaemolyticus TaxID=670 RepID=UPI00111DF0EF|nr:hypothetical protein [Vibrio parahaemolyticus]MDF4725808.1 hypothetical protein [Vibrio parahaemolyticus]MDF4952560.1 hypothetical protein [Vibrio parahaemolyticus]HCE1548617.1 hypothetical protein [Vibrio parahaemolyticus]HCH4677475.1 hypothetical protein [Vibrio parahaemolyticus]
MFDEDISVSAKELSECISNKVVCPIHQSSAEVTESDDGTLEVKYCCSPFAELLDEIWEELEV